MWDPCVGRWWWEGTWEQFKLQKQLTQSASFVIDLGKEEATTAILRPPPQDAAQDLAHLWKLLKT